jgi:hypothetical protein
MDGSLHSKKLPHSQMRTMMRYVSGAVAARRFLQDMCAALLNAMLHAAHTS